MSNKKSKILNHADSVIEAYKTIRANLVLSLIKDGCKIVVVSSAGSQDGKTTSAVNLSVSLSQINCKVLLIDADLRKSGAHTALNIDNSSGLSNIIFKEASAKELIKDTAYSGLSFLSSGKKVDNPSEVLASRYMKELIEELSSDYDYIIVDTPPLDKYSDCLPIAQFADGVILTVRQHNTNISALEKSVKSLEFIKANIIGFIYIGND